MQKIKNIVAIGGGTGTFTVLSALKNRPDVHLSAIVSMADDGGSTGMLRDQYGALPPGDIRRALVALSESGDVMRDLFNYRFRRGGLHGHSFGNLFLAALEKITGDFASAVREASRILNVNGEVVPVTLDNVRLYARLADDTTLRGESSIDIPLDPNRPQIEKVWLRPAARINPDAKRVLSAADLIVIGPGDLYTSLVPNLLVKGMPKAIRESKAKKLYLVNLMTKFGETQNFKGEDFVKEIEKYLGKNVLSKSIFNNKRPSASTLARYCRENSEFVEPPRTRGRGRTKYALADLLDSGGLIRHSPRKLARTLIKEAV